MISEKRKRYEPPRNCDEVVDLLLSDLTAHDMEILTHLSVDEFEAFYGEAAATILDEFNLWTGNDRLLNSCLLSDHAEQGASDPARVIVEKMRDRLQEMSGVVILA